MSPCPPPCGDCARCHREAAARQGRALFRRRMLKLRSLLAKAEWAIRDELADVTLEDRRAHPKLQQKKDLAQRIKEALVATDVTSGE